MRYCTCPKCNSKLEVYENDYMPGCREMEEYYCPECGNCLGKIFTSDIPFVRKIDEIDKREG